VRERAYVLEDEHQVPERNRFPTDKKIHDLGPRGRRGLFV
jgi:hypothetical protein